MWSELQQNKLALHVNGLFCSVSNKKSNVKIFSPSILHIPRFLASISPSVVLHGLTGVTYFHTSPCIWVNWSAHPDRLNYSSLSFLCFFYFIWSVTIYSLCFVYRISSCFWRSAALQNMWKKVFFKGSCKYFWMDDKLTAGGWCKLSCHSNVCANIKKKKSNVTF